VDTAIQHLLRAAESHDEAADAHDRAAALFSAKDDDERSELAHRAARLEREFAELTRDRATIRLRRHG
jgi:hypothetical protein